MRLASDCVVCHMTLCTTGVHHRLSLPPVCRSPQGPANAPKRAQEAGRGAGEKPKILACFFFGFIALCCASLFRSCMAYLLCFIFFFFFMDLDFNRTFHFEVCFLGQNLKRSTWNVLGKVG